MKTKKYEVEIGATTYRTYYITAESEEKAEDMAFEEMDADWEISKVWKQNAEISFLEEIEDTPKLSAEQMDGLMSEVKKKNLVKKRKLHESGSNEIVSDWHDECEKK